MINHERYIRGEITAGKLLELETCPQDVVGGFANLIDALKVELSRAVQLLDGECTRPDGSNADTLGAHKLLERLTDEEYEKRNSIRHEASDRQLLNELIRRNDLRLESNPAWTGHERLRGILYDAGKRIAEWDGRDMRV